MSREVAERCDLCRQFKPHADLVTVHVLGEPVDVCTECQALPVGNLLAQIRGHAGNAAPAAGAPGEYQP
jgi:hypothetical protein